MPQSFSYPRYVDASPVSGELLQQQRQQQRFAGELAALRGELETLRGPSGEGCEEALLSQMRAEMRAEIQGVRVEIQQLQQQGSHENTVEAMRELRAESTDLRHEELQETRLRVLERRIAALECR